MAAVGRGGEPMNQVVERWNHFWFAPGTTAPLGLFRIFFGFAAFLKMSGLFGLIGYEKWKLRLYDSERQNGGAVVPGGAARTSTSLCVTWATCQFWVPMLKV